VENSGNIQKLFFGLNRLPDESLMKWERLMTDAGLEATWSANITQVVWEKFIFLSPTATATSYFDKNLGEVRSTPACREAFAQLVDEVMQLASAKGIGMA